MLKVIDEFKPQVVSSTRSRRLYLSERTRMSNPPDPSHGPPEERPHYLPFYDPDLFRGGPPGGDRGRYLFPGGYLDSPAGHRTRRGAEPGIVYFEVPRDGAFQPGAGVLNHRQRSRFTGCVRRPGGRSDRFGADCAGSPGKGVGSGPPAGRSQRQKRQVEAKRKAIEAQIASLQAELQAEEQEFQKAVRRTKCGRAKSLNSGKRWAACARPIKRTGRNRSHM